MTPTDTRVKPDGLHHLAIATADIKTQIAFFTDVLGCELVALYWMHGVKGAWHGFVKLSDTASIAFVQSPEIAGTRTELGVSHSGTPGGACAPGTMQHVAFNVADDGALLAMRDRIRSRGVPVFGPVDHGFCKSIYFAGPEHLTLELSTSKAAIDARAWIDPEVVALAGITAEELARFKAPAKYHNDGPPLPQPAHDPAKPHMTHPEMRYRAMLATPDDRYTRERSDTEPPVKIAAE
ncbi:MAG: VOC family protein [Alphaproteobacteria bacterium]|nr:VOC family protein [Alphaproteobacteria bacterium]